MLAMPVNNVDEPQPGAPDSIEDIPSLLEKYPWPEWTDGQLHIITLSDYEVSLTAIRTRLHQKAEKLGKRCKTKTVEEGKLAFQFLDK